MKIKINSKYFINNVKLNFKCPFGTNGPDFSCGQDTDTSEKVPDKILSIITNQYNKKNNKLVEVKKFSGMKKLSNGAEIGHVINKVLYNNSREGVKGFAEFTRPGYQVVQVYKSQFSDDISTYGTGYHDDLIDAEDEYERKVSGNENLASRRSSISIINTDENIDPEINTKLVKDGTKFAQQSNEYLKSKGITGKNSDGSKSFEIDPVENYSRRSVFFSDFITKRPNVEQKIYKNQDEFEEALEKAGYDNYIINDEGNPKYDYRVINEMVELSNIIKDNKIPEDMRLFSGISAGFASQLTSLQPGTVFKTPNFLSTSWKKNVANKFSDNNKSNVVLDIVARKGTEALGTEIWQDENPRMSDTIWGIGEHGKFNDPKKLEKYGNKNSQREVILNSNQKYKIIGIRNEKRRQYIVVETIPDWKSE